MDKDGKEKSSERDPAAASTGGRERTAEEDRGAVGTRL
jgi:hypothetical protein